MRTWTVLLLAAATGACAPAANGGAGDGPAPVRMDPAQAGAQRPMVPAGYGTLRQDDITMSVRSGGVLVKVTPLDEATIRLLAPDTHTRLQSLRESRVVEAAAATMRPPELFLVSFFGAEADATFQPEDVQLFFQSRPLRPQAVLPITAGFGRQRLALQETQAAVYAFDGPLDYDQPIMARYGTTESDEWRQILQRLENERGKIMARVR